MVHTETARDRLPSTPRRYQAVAEATTDTQLASYEVTELAGADLDVGRKDHRLLSDGVMLEPAQTVAMASSRR